MKNQGNPKARTIAAPMQNYFKNQPSKNSQTLDFDALTYGTKSNWVAWENNMKYRACENYGAVSDIFTNDAYPVYPPPEYDEVVRNENPHHYDIVYRENLKQQMNQIATLTERKELLYGYMMRHISKESEQKCRESPNWEATATNKDPLELLRILKATHIGVTTGNGIVDKEIAEKAYVNVRQGENESLIDYKQRFEHLVNALTTVGATVPPNNEQSVKFVKGLNSNYQHMKDYYSENVQLDPTATYPATITLAYNIAESYRPPQSKQRGKKPKGVVYAATATDLKPSASNSSSAPEANTVVATTANAAYQGKKNNKRKFDQTSQEEGKSFCICRCCILCPGTNDHWPGQCPKFLEAVEKGMFDSMGATNASNNHSDPPHQYNTRRKRVNIITCNLSAYGELILKKDEWTLDCGSEIALVSDLVMISNPRRSEFTIEITVANGEKFYTNVYGDTIFGPAYYHPKAALNIVPFGRTEKMFDVEYHRNEGFKVFLNDGQEVMFEKRESDDDGNGLYIWEGPRDTTKRTVAVTTVEDNKMSYSKREINDAKQAKDLIRKLGYPSTRQAIEMLQSGAILECPITVQDIIRAEDIFGPDIAALKGKSTHRKIPPIKVDLVNKPTSQVQTLYTDVMFLDNEPYLVSISSPLNLGLASKLKSRAEEDIASAITGHIRVYTSEGFTISKVFCDNEGGIIASKGILANHGVVLNLSTSGHHVPQIERFIRTVKERIRSIIMSLPFRLPYSFMEYLVDFVIMRINSTPKTTGSSIVSPREQFTGRKINYKKDLRFGFGDYAQIEVPSPINKNSVRIPRTEGAIAVCPTGNLQGSVIFYLLSSGKFVARDQFRLLPMPTEVIDRLNSMEGKSSRAEDDVFVSDTYHEDYQEDTLQEYRQPVHSTVGIDTEGPNIQPDEVEDEIIAAETITTEVATEEQPSQDTRRYPVRDRRPTERLTFAAKHQSIQSTLKKYEKETTQAVRDELSQMRSKDVFDPVEPDITPPGTLPSFMFMKEKFLSNGDLNT